MDSFLLSLFSINLLIFNGLEEYIATDHKSAITGHVISLNLI